MSERIPICEVEFFGGPQDGHVEPVYASPAPVVVIAQSPPAQGTGFSLTALLRWFLPKTVRLYTYRLVSYSGAWRYEHTGTEVAKLSELEDLDCVVVGGVSNQQSRS
jgi:hypothetical protein